MVTIYVGRGVLVGHIPAGGSWRDARPFAAAEMDRPGAADREPHPDLFPELPPVPPVPPEPPPCAAAR